jgi:hypothetical protein
LAAEIDDTERMYMERMKAATSTLSPYDRLLSKFGRKKIDPGVRRGSAVASERRTQLRGALFIVFLWF